MAAAEAVAHVARFHRIQGSPGFRQAAEWLHGQLAAAGLKTRILTYPANQTASFWGADSFQEWAANTATLHLVEPAEKARKLSDYRAMPLSLVARSRSFDGEAEVVVLQKGDDPAEYAGIDVRGKVVLARGNTQRVNDLAVARYGAVGLLYDGMMEVEPVRPPWALPDTVQYTSFWWQGREPQGFGFALTPREGERLRRLAQEQTLRIRAHVDARLYDGSLENVEAVIPGQTEQEIVLVAHLCHPQPSANDNGSGVAALLEVARALAALLERGDLAPPRRTIRFLWVPEMTGSFAYLAENEAHIPRMVAGLNLDMVGQDQEQCGSSLLFEHPPGAFPNFTTTLLGRLRENWIDEAKGLGGTASYPLFRYADVPFGGGSDHYIFADPSVGVPMPMVIQWPDRYYHTSDDTPDRVDPRMLERVGTLAAVYAYWLAQAGESEARWLTRELSARFRQETIAEIQDAITHADEEDGMGRESLQQRLTYQVDRHRVALESVRRLASVDVGAWQKHDAEFAAAEGRQAADLLPNRAALVPPEVAGADMVPRRRFRGPIQPGPAIARLDTAGQDRWADWQKRISKLSRTAPVLAEYWADGQRSITDIAALVQQEMGIETTGLLVEYFSMLAQLDLVDLG
ncbi:MAG: DUF4910 domain-containing protein [Anaerolineae bacterium]|nr:DUF4910 domain-containing protein [Anaerolineae bacterium]